MKTSFFRSWKKCFTALVFVLVFVLNGPSCARVRPIQKVTCTNASYVNVQRPPRDVPCQTKCGLRLYGSDDCQGFQIAENRAVKVYSKHFQSVCKTFKNWNVVVQPPGFETTGWNSSVHDGGVIGLTFCAQKEMQIETGNWKDSSLSHEMLHVLTWCDRDHDAGEDCHAGWEDGGLPWVPEAIDSASGL